ncbi:hypothetical protein AT1G47280 [Arabidopsis thaliana]|uniref:At1g47280 n=2 Tax=Arabidopsis thaliana TaxID=3702 RepID=Q1PFM9_ARATH|nr:uncharacterized protein AT1G47280 [Arabidopsis thaliana]ABE65695.1 unknown [Arabidopsis thaliana]ABH04509.1 At1g47280 [Arabidopsis thaliana]AEE32151.1 hypothetical protein AT1G47280 [Arabidopsis thaliana]|eukprot:NP_564501.1 hypothetical protein AT1G47280 [Arabidopsis thaliana]
MEKVKFFAIIFTVSMVMTMVSAEELPVKVTGNEMTLAAEAAASSFKSSAGEAAQGAKSWADWATSKIRHLGSLEKTPGSD